MKIFVTRRRNSITNTLVSLLADIDYNFDYRGKSKFLLLLKAAITSSEINVEGNFFFEGIASSYVSFFLKKRGKFIMYCNGPDFYYLENAGYFKKKIFKILLRKIDVIITISKMVEYQAKKNFPEKKIINVGFYCDMPSVKLLEYEPVNKLYSINIIMAIDRPIETGFIKGLDFALESFYELRGKYPLVKLDLIGSGTSKLINLPVGVTGLGFTDPKTILDQYHFALIPSRYDAYNLFGHECLLRGVIPIFSKNVGIAYDLGIPEEYLIDHNDSLALLNFFNAYNPAYVELIKNSFAELILQNNKQKFFDNVRLQFI
jgi:glycosyltransferase involved in cell wall biosynthesis